MGIMEEKIIIMKKFIKKIALLFPPVKRLKRRIGDMRSQIESLNKEICEMRSEIESLYGKNKELRSLIENYKNGYEGLKRQLDSAIDNGNKKVCPICSSEFLVYLPGPFGKRKNASCPYCGSLERHRALYLFFERNTNLFNRNELSTTIKILHFAPEPCLYNKIKNIPNKDYFPVDIDPSAQGIRDVIDIQNIKYEDCTFDIIICNHVMEHIPDDRSAMRELKRVLKSGGVAYINTPVDYTLDWTLESPEYNTPELRTKYYGQFDHVRLYGKDYVTRLQDAGFDVCVIEPNKDLNEEEIQRYGLLKDEIIYKCE